MSDLPFDRAQFLELFVLYNNAVWPMQIVLNLLALATLALVMVRGARSSRAISAMLALLWLWTAVAYHLLYFRQINPAALLFGLIFLAGAAAFALAGVVHGRLRFEPTRTPATAVGIALVSYSLLIYPVLSHLLGHSYPAMPTFGLPCPTTLFTFGMLAFLQPGYPRYVFVAPVLWALVGSQAAWFFGIYQDTALLAAAGAGIWIASRNRLQITSGVRP